MRKQLTIILILVIASTLLLADLAKADNLADKLKGKILLQVEAHGEAWYVNPADSRRYYMGRPYDAFNLMRELGVGITNGDLENIQIADINLSGSDADNDGLSDIVEDAVSTNKNKADTDNDGYNDKDEILNGFNPKGFGKLNIDKNFADRQNGRILLQVEAHGEAWYVNPDNSKRYFLGRPADAFNIMRSLGLGITNNNLEQIPLIILNNSSLLGLMEKNIHSLINNERASNELNTLKWNNEVASVAREHSLNLAKENKPLVDLNARCNFPVIHHEGVDFGLYQKERLENRGIYYLGASGENIALMPTAKEVKYKSYSDSSQIVSSNYCQDQYKALEADFKNRLENASDEEKGNIIEEEIKIREKLLEEEPRLEILDIIVNTESEIEKNTVQGWMNSKGHRENILDSNYNEAGIGIAKVGDYLIITQVFIKKVDCGYKTGPCCEKEGYYPSCYLPLSCDSGICR